jgi:hypothetical protein
MTIDRATVTCPGSASATPAKITARAQSPRINLMMGRIASLLGCAQTAYLAHPACAQAGQASRFWTENEYISPVNKRGGLEMNLSPPTTAVFIISLILAVLAIIGTFVAIPLISANAFWVAIIAYFVLAIGNVFRGV